MKNSVRIGIDIRPLQTDYRLQGVGHYAAGLLQGLGQLDLPWTFVLFHDHRLPLDLDLPPGLRAELVSVWRPRWEPRTQEIWNQILTPIDVLAHRVSLFHTITPQFVPAWTPSPRVVTIPDLIPFGEFSPLRTGLKYRFLYRSAARADVIVTMSEATRRDLLALFAPRQERVITIHLGVETRFFNPISREQQEKTRLAYGIQPPYILYLGDLRAQHHNARKNLPTLLDAFAATRRDIGDWSLVLAGKKGEYAALLARQATDLGIAQQMTFTDFVPEEDLPALMAGAEIFAYPSRYEGFGLPVLQAMAAGVPVLTSNCSSLPEITGEAALLINPADVEEMRRTLLQLMRDEALRRDLSVKGRARAQQFTWAKTARQTVAAYELALDRTKAGNGIHWGGN